MPITAIILAGGQSRRMGTDKAALEIKGATLLERTARVALGADLPVLVAGRVRPLGWLLETVFVEDAHPGLGPLGGLSAALGQTQTSVLALACDLPLLTADALRWLLAQFAEQRGEHGLVTINGDRWEPLFSLYQPSVLPKIDTRLMEGRRSLHGLIEAGDFAFVQAPDWVRTQLVNVNTADEWGKIRASGEQQKR
ncbi:MAG: molybdenum cofactor guanylyltransferase [Janthinobacterium lividum]